jgi:hypothetical protein
MRSIRIGRRSISYDMGNQAFFFFLVSVFIFKQLIQNMKILINDGTTLSLTPGQAQSVLTMLRMFMLRRRWLRR